MLYTDLSEIPAGYGPSAVTIGKFDGVHAGHRAVIGELLEEASARHARSVVVTFDRHPLALLKPEKCPSSLVGNRQKTDLIAQTGVDDTVLLRFDEAFSQKSPDAFVRDILVEALHAVVVLVGADFRFGHKGAGTVDTLTEFGRQHGFEVRVVEDVAPKDGRRVSSTWIRELLAQGEVRQAAELLGHLPTVSGVVVHGAKRGRELGFPTANLSPDSDGLIPSDGVYAGWLVRGGASYPAAISVGNNPTFDGVPQKQVEAYVLDETLDLYDDVVDVKFVERLRGQVAYRGIEPLIEQMHEDVAKVREILTQTA